MVRVRVNYVRDSFSVLLGAAHHYSMLMTFVSATTANLKSQVVLLRIYKSTL